MKSLVVDANQAIAILIKQGKPLNILLFDELELVAPALLFDEIERNSKTIVKKSSLQQKEIQKFAQVLRNRIRVVHEQEFLKHLQKAKAICPDKKDIQYFALALHMNCPIWSNDKKLKEQKEIKVYSTHDLLRMLNKE